MSAWLIVKAEVVDPAAKEGFDRWYQDKHLPEAKAAFAALRAWRGWSEIEPSHHYAFYEFADVGTAMAISESDAIKGLIAEFDSLWANRVTRTRDVVTIDQFLDNAP